MRLHRTPTRTAGRAVAFVAAFAWLAACGSIVVPSDNTDVADAGDTAGNDTRVNDVVGAVATCADYCAQIQVACTTDALKQYASEAACNLYCETWGKIPKGTPDDLSGNTVGCRTYHATVAQTGDPATHCPHAGPSGGNVCGSWCENYCHLAAQNCKGDQRLYRDAVDCMEECGEFQTDGEPGDTEFDNVQCRIHYLGLAGTEPPLSAELNCPLAAVLSEMCVDATPSSCTGGNVPTSEGCLACDTVLIAEDDYKDTAQDIYANCAVDGDCVLIDDSTPCRGSCGAAAHKDFAAQYVELLDEFGDQYCEEFGLDCTVSPATCPAVELTAQCLQGECVAAP